MNVLFVEPSFPNNQREFVRALHAIGCRVTGIGERPYDWLDGELRHWLAGYEQVRSVTDEGAVIEAVRRVQGREWVDRLEATVEAHILPIARVREACTIPGLSSRAAYLCRDKVAMKEVLRRAGVPCAASAAVSSAHEAWEFAARRRLPADRQAARRRGRRRHPSRRRSAGAGARAARHRRGRRRRRRDRGIRRGTRGFLRHARRRRPRRPRLHQPLLSERARGDAHALDQPADRRHQPHGLAGLRRALRDGPPGDRGDRHHHRADAYGVVLRPERPALLRDRCAPAGRRPMGRLLRRQRVRPLSRMGARGDAPAHREPAFAPLFLRHDRAPPDRDGRISHYDGAEEIFRRYGEWIVAHHFPPPGTPTQPVEAGYMANAWMRIRHPDYDRLREILNTVGETIKVRAL